jgi:hypothetical protein
MPDLFHEKPSDVTTRRRRGFAGQVMAGTGVTQLDAINASGTLAHTVDLTVTSYSGGLQYAFTLTKDGRAISYSKTVAAGDDTEAEVATALVTDILNRAGDLLDIVYPSVVSNKVRLQAIDAGAASVFVISGLTNLSQSTVYAGADAASISFGRGVIRVNRPVSTSVFAASQTRSTMDEFMALPNSTTLAPMSHTFVFAGSYTSGDLFDASGNIRWGDKIIPIAFQAGAAQTTVDTAGAEIAATLNANWGSYLTAAYTASSNTLVVTSDFNGLEFDIVITAPGTNTVTKSSANTDKVAADLFRGVTSYRFVNGTTDIDSYNTSIPPNDSGVYLARGAIWVMYAGTAPTAGQTVYLCTGSGEEGYLSATPAAHRVPLPRSLAVWHAADGDTAPITLSVS